MVTLHNTCKKLAQLNKVIGYLETRLVEIKFQAGYLRSHFRGEIEPVEKAHVQKMDDITSGLREQQVEVGKTISELYIDRHKELNYTVRKKTDKLVKQVQTEEQNIMNEISRCKSALMLLTEEIARLGSGDGLDIPSVEAFQASLADKRVKFASQIDNLYGETKEKLDDLEKKSKERQQDMERHFDKLRKDVAVGFKPTIKPSDLKMLEGLRKKGRLILQDVEKAKKDLLHQQSITAQNFHGFKARVGTVDRKSVV